MKSPIVGITLAFLVTFASSPILAQPEPAPAYVGEVIIVGNTISQDRDIRQAINLVPGQVLRYPELKIAERNLARLGIFEMNPELGVRSAA